VTPDSLSPRQQEEDTVDPDVAELKEAFARMESKLDDLKRQMAMIGCFVRDDKDKHGRD
jgi:hypothetical protein